MIRLFRLLPCFAIAFIWCGVILGAGQVEVPQPHLVTFHSSVGPQPFQGTNVVGDVPRATLTPNLVPLLNLHLAADESNAAPAPSRLGASKYTVPCFATLRYYTHNLQLEGG